MTIDLLLPHPFQHTPSPPSPFLLSLPTVRSITLALSLSWSVPVSVTRSMRTSPRACPSSRSRPPPSMPSTPCWQPTQHRLRCNSNSSFSNRNLFSSSNSSVRPRLACHYSCPTLPLPRRPLRPQLQSFCASPCHSTRLPPRLRRH
ncbi:hypothetical protein K457DRAFT_1282222 [Linnemannia elongata AG-77]|uniref:Uncharacterized protein n=1 Tax=Linnemannia elongata AG-77 TaxID=1314771 RepID=A0A197JZ92_9FUNG|nr:hypothetical protein K457DRAFT_1282222 [Linnemannia elongata AG-77]